MEYVFQHIDETFDINNCINYTLSIQCSLDGLSFCIFDNVVEKYIVLSEYKLNCVTPFQLKNSIESIFGSEEILKHNFKRVNVCYVSLNLTLAPISLISDKNYTELTGFVFEPEHNDEHIYNKTPNGNVFVSLIPGVVKELFRIKYSSCIFYTSAIPVINNDSLYKQTGNRVHISLFNHTMQVLAFNLNSIKLLNTFYVKNDADCLYYTLSCLKSIAFDKKTVIILSGDFQKESFFTTTIRKYFDVVVTAHFNNRFAYSYTFYSEQEHRFIHLTELAQCE
jgi:hypothetical protein